MIAAVLGSCGVPSQDIDDCAQEFKAKLFSKAFEHYDPRRGRFRDYYGKSVVNFAIDFCRRHGRDRLRFDGDVEKWLAPTAQFLGAETLRHAREGLDGINAQIIRLYEEAPEATAAELAPQANCTEEAIRKRLQRARERLAQLLVEEVCRQLGDDITPEAAEDELRAQGLWQYVQPHLNQMRSTGEEADE